MVTSKKEGKPIKAIHIEVKKDHSREAKNIFLALYSASATKFPLSIRMQYVPSILPTTNTRTKKQIQDFQKNKKGIIRASHILKYGIYSI